MVSVLFREGLLELEIDNNLEQGFICLGNDEEKHALWHCWVQVNGHDVDISSRITRQLFPNFNKVWKTSNKRLSKIIPEDHDRIDQDTPQEITQLVKNEKMYKSYSQNPSRFWTDAQKDADFLSICDKIKNLKNMINDFTEINTEGIKSDELHLNDRITCYKATWSQIEGPPGFRDTEYYDTPYFLTKEELEKIWLPF